MDVSGRKVLVLGGYGLVGIAVCRELLARSPAELQIHSLRESECIAARDELLAEWPDANIVLSWGDLFGLADGVDPERELELQLDLLRDPDLAAFRLYQLLVDKRPDIVIDCVNTATGIAYRDIFRSATKVRNEVERGEVATDSARELLEALYVPRLIRHIQVLYRGMIEAETRIYLKVGTSGTGGMGLNIPYTHSEEKPSRVLLSKSALAGAHSLLLFLMARTPGAPITKEIKPAAAIAWKKIGAGPISRRAKPVWLMQAEPQEIGERFSTVDESAATVTDQQLETVFIDTGENGIFSIEEFSMLTTASQMEFVTPEEIARYLIYEIEGGNTGHDIINALDNAVLGPTYRAGVLRHFALDKMNELQADYPTRSVAFEMLGPPRNTKLLFEAHLLREEFSTMRAVHAAEPDEIRDRLNQRVLECQRTASEIISIGVPILLDDGRLLRGTEVLVPSEVREAEVTPERVEMWVEGGWVDLRLANCARWQQRMATIFGQIEAIPEGDTSSRYVRTPQFWGADQELQPGKVVSWVLTEEEQGGRIKR